MSVELKPDPRIVTGVPTGPFAGENAEIVTWFTFWRVIESKFPTGS